MFANLHFHRHENLEKVHKVPAGHVIIDLESYDTIMNLIKEEKKIQQIKNVKINHKKLNI